MKVLVVHPAQQHSYRLAAALSRKGLLYKYVTTVYWKKGSLTYFASLFLKDKLKTKARGRHCQELNSEDVVQFCELEGLIKIALMQIPSLKPIYKKVKYHLTNRFARKVARYAIQNQVDAVVCYDDYSSRLFELLHRKAPDILRIMDVSAANILYMRKIYDTDTALQPAFADLLHSERSVVWDKENIARAKKEQGLTDIFLVPSIFVKRSLRYAGVANKKMKVCPYGVDELQFAQKKYHDYEVPLRRPIRFIYVGGVKELKGISYLLEAISKLPVSQASLTVVGHVDKSRMEIKPYLHRVSFTGSVLHEQVPKLLRKSDVFVFPSLGEGLSLSTLEAASCGLPLIVSENSGVNDAITEGKEGFVIPIQSTSAFIEKMSWFIKNPDKIETMGRAAREMALQYTWDNYYARMGQIFDKIEEDYGQNS